MSKPAANTVRCTRVIAAVVCAVAALVVFVFYGNANRGYIDSASLLYWWTFQWTNPGSETEHGWLILGLSAWLLWRNLRPEKGARGGVQGKLETTDQGPQTTDHRLQTTDRGPTTRDQGPETEDQLPGDPKLESRNPQPRQRNPKPETRNLAPAAAAMLGGLGLHAIGFAAQQARLSIVAFLLFTWGVLRLGGGRRWGAAAAFPLGFMLFAIPVNVLDTLGFWLRMGVVDASAAIARTAGIPVVQSGTQLFAPDGRYNYDVAAACSGVRSLTAMVALSLLAGYLNFQGAGRRVFALLLSLPLVYVGNVARIVAIVFAAQWGGPKWGDIAHELMGYGIFAIVLGGVLLGISLLRRWWPEQNRCHLLNDTSGRGLPGDSGECHLIDDTGLPSPRGEGAGSAPAMNRLADGELAPPAAAPRRTRDGPDERRSDREALESGGRRHLAGWRPALLRPGFVAALIVILAGAEIGFLHHLANAPSRGEVGVRLAAGGTDPAELPAFLGTEWVGRRTEVTAIEREILPADTGYSRKLYVPVADPGRAVLLSIVLSGRDRTSIHRPELCLVGQGWSIAGKGGHRFRVPGATMETFPATVLRVKREAPGARGRTTVPSLTVYWFMGGDGIVATHWQRVARDSWNRVVHARADRWAYVLMQTDASDGEAAALARMQTVLDQTLPVFAPPAFAGPKP